MCVRVCALRAEKEILSCGMGMPREESTSAIFQQLCFFQKCLELEKRVWLKAKSTGTRDLKTGYKHGQMTL
jgi:hypothetical protein